MWESILTGFVANLVFLIFMAFVGWSLFAITHRKSLYSFFNVTSSRRLIIYLSNLQVVRGGAIGVDARPRSYQGITVTFFEYSVSEALRRMFYYPIQTITGQPGLLRKLFISDIQIEIKASPLSEAEIDGTASIVSLGSPAYNVVSGYIEQNLHSYCRFQNDFRQMILDNAPPISDTTQAFIERLVDTDNNRSVFYVAGLSEIGTVGAMQFLTFEWKRLYKKYRDRPFSIMVKFYPTTVPTDSPRWSIVFEREN